MARKRSMKPDPSHFKAVINRRPKRLRVSRGGSPKHMLTMLMAAAFLP
jgi:hypothetical protein